MDPWDVITLASTHVELGVVRFGATVTALRVDRGKDQPVDVVLGHLDVRSAPSPAGYLGATVGRFANRIAGHEFTLDGERHVLSANEGPTTLHGGQAGLDQQAWDVLERTASRVLFGLTSADGDQGFPGELTVRAEYQVNGNHVRLEYQATTNRPTVVNLTNHSYFNLDGEGSGSVDEHLLTVHADAYLPTDPALIPTGELADVAGTPFDLRKPTVIGDAIRTPHPQTVRAKGIDHCYVVRGSGLRPVTELHSPRTGVRLLVSSDQAAVQIYTGNQLDGTMPGKSGRLYRQGDGVALETQAFPDAPNRPEFPSTALRPGETYRSVTQWTFDSSADPE